MKNQTALVTGAKQGIGKGIALNLAKEGYNIVVADIVLKDCQALAKEIEALGVQALPIKCDVSKRVDVVKMMQVTKKKFGKLDVLVNNAGVYPFQSFVKMNEKDWDKVIDINLKGVYFTVQEGLKVMPAGGRIVNISSIASLVGFAGLAHYCASKGALNAMIRALALELAPKKITVNNVAPGAIVTPGASGASTPESAKQTIAMIPLARMGEPEDIAGAVAYLVSPSASYVTGQTIVVDGGWTLR
ncbi:SDR family oxidoreductase [Patescibacteria group bacterium]|nr:SDR family oxidoreductase [Patescibacteria group bacterium]MBU1895555.1 SDR family oxidoreductase [Patescibacteria group bacterium]